MELVNNWNRDTHWPKAFCARNRAAPGQRGRRERLPAHRRHPTLAALGNFIRSTVEYGTDLFTKIEQAIALPSAQALEQWMDRTG